ncbi:hypothetical protein CMI46_02090 [Candidatus Pacearchaeota archaeon]|nr:hypothetical protein [Candidatus Pacearchaeota archaeon]|tara:strand:+ start:9978 stop:10559 length:582 start_codon:yes stop_codon:yes gene_type:complete
MRKAILFVGLFVFMFSLQFVSADVQLVCLEKGETLEFSLCNSDIPDRTCESSGGCQFCVNEIEEDVFCPQHINKCNNDGASCQNDGGFDSVEREEEDEEDDRDRDDGDDDSDDGEEDLDSEEGVVTGGRVGTRISVGDVSDNSGGEDYYRFKIKKSVVKYGGLGFLPLIEIGVLIGLIYYEKKILLKRRVRKK